MNELPIHEGDMVYGFMCLEKTTYDYVPYVGYVLCIRNSQVDIVTHTHSRIEGLHYSPIDKRLWKKSYNFYFDKDEFLKKLDSYLSRYHYEMDYYKSRADTLEDVKTTLNDKIEKLKKWSNE